MFGIILGFVLLVIGTEAMLRGGLDVLRWLHVPAWFGAATLVAYGTATPELLIASAFSWLDYPLIALGNIMGSTLCNLLLVMGVAACLLPLKDDSRETRQLCALLVATMGLVYYFLQDGVLERYEAAVLLLGILGVTARNLWCGRAELRAAPSPFPDTAPSFPGTVFCLLLAGVLLPVGIFILLQSTLQLAYGAELPIGIIVTLLAFGSALPELTMVLLAARHRSDTPIIRTLLASSLFNITAILGIAGLVAPLHVPEVTLKQDAPVLLGAMLFCGFLLLFMKKIPKVAGALLVGLYLCYILWRLP